MDTFEKTNIGDDQQKRNAKRVANLSRHRDLLINKAHSIEGQIIDSNGLPVHQICALSKQLASTIAALNQINNMHSMYKAKGDIVEPVRTPIIQLP